MESVSTHPMKTFYTSLAILSLLTISVAHGEQADSVSLVVLVSNPSETASTVWIRCDLPLGGRPQDVTDVGAMRIAYDTSGGRHYLWSQCELLSSGSTTIVVRTKESLWRIAPVEFRDIRERFARVRPTLERILHDSGTAAPLLVTEMFSRAARHSGTLSIEGLSEMEPAIVRIEKRQVASPTSVSMCLLRDRICELDTIYSIKILLHEMEEIKCSYDKNPEQALSDLRHSARTTASAPWVNVRLRSSSGVDLAGGECEWSLPSDNNVPLSEMHHIRIKVVPAGGTAAEDRGESGTRASGSGAADKAAIQ